MIDFQNFKDDQSVDDFECDSECSLNTQNFEGSKCKCKLLDEEEVKKMGANFDATQKERLYRKLERKIYFKSKEMYYFWRFMKRFVKSGEGCCWGMIDGFGTGMGCGVKWGGAGGWIVGTFSEFFATLVGTSCAVCIGFIIGCRTDRKRVKDYWKNYRDTLGVGGGASSALRGTWN